jgi:hypothetical protein
MPTNFVGFGSENSSAAHPVKIASHQTIGMIEVFAGSIGVQPEGEKASNCRTAADWRANYAPTCANGLLLSSRQRFRDPLPEVIAKGELSALGRGDPDQIRMGQRLRISSCNARV